MTDLRKAAEQALTILSDPWNDDQIDLRYAAEALRQALAEPANSTTDFVEPKASSQTEQKGHCVCGHPEALEVVHFRTRPCFHYIHRPKREWVGLTADEIWKCNKAETGSAVEFHICSAHQNVMDFAEAIEQALKEKNS